MSRKSDAQSRQSDRKSERPDSKGIVPKEEDIENRPAEDTDEEEFKTL